MGWGVGGGHVLFLNGNDRNYLKFILLLSVPGVVIVWMYTSSIDKMYVFFHLSFQI